MGDALFLRKSRRIEKRRLQPPIDFGRCAGSRVCRRELRCRFQHRRASGAPPVCCAGENGGFQKPRQRCQNPAARSLAGAPRLALPKYRIEKQTGEGDDARFEVSCDLGELGFICSAEAGSPQSRRQANRQRSVGVAGAKPPVEKSQKIISDGLGVYYQSRPSETQEQSMSNEFQLPDANGYRCGFCGHCRPPQCGQIHADEPFNRRKISITSRKRKPHGTSNPVFIPMTRRSLCLSTRPVSNQPPQCLSTTA